MLIESLQRDCPVCQTPRRESPSGAFICLVCKTSQKWIHPIKGTDEGYVVRFSTGLRLKIKHNEYVRLHRLLTQTSARDIWDLLRNNKEIDELLELVPDEFYTWVQSVVDRLREEWGAIHMQAANDFQKRPDTDDRKTHALYFQTCQYPGLCFLLLDGKYDRLYEQIWKMIRPAHEIPFVMEV